MCKHRAANRWFRFWDRFTITFLTVFAVAEVYGMTTEGPDAAYTSYWRRLLGQLEPCRHSLIGRGILVTVMAWVAAHLGWGLPGLDVPRLHRSSQCPSIHEGVSHVQP
jgi:hypothetical protein